MQTIRREDKMIASSLHPDIASRTPTPSRTESRPRKPLVLLLCGLILSGVVAPPAADAASARPNSTGCRRAAALNYQNSHQDERDFAYSFKVGLYVEIVCNHDLHGGTITKAEQRFLNDIEAGK
jgi:hypothetical protein